MESPESKLLKAATSGDVEAILELLRKDPLVLDIVSYSSPNNTPLHVATTKGHEEFVKVILRKNPQLAEELNSQQSTALHIASAQGYLEIVRSLLEAAPHTCLSHDSQGRNPLHLAAINGRVLVLKELVERAPLAAQEKLGRGLTVLHLCVKHNQLEALKILVQELSELINAKNDDGHTILHMAVMGKNLQMIEFLLDGNCVGKVKVNSLNLEGMTALDVYRSISGDQRHSEIEKSLKLGGGIGASEQGGWLDKQKNALIVVASLIATIAFQIGVNPAGGVWQEDNFLSDSHGNFVDLQGNVVYPPINSNNQTVFHPHQAGYPILSERHPVMHAWFYVVNTTAFIASLSIILALMSGFPTRRRFFLWILMAITWIEITGTALVYIISVGMLRFNENYTTGSPGLNVIGYAVIVWICMVSLLVFAHAIRLSLMLVKKLKRRNMKTYGRIVEPSP